jgi:hypothetical protein
MQWRQIGRTGVNDRALPLPLAGEVGNPEDFRVRAGDLAEKRPCDKRAEDLLTIPAQRLQ